MAADIKVLLFDAAGVLFHANMVVGEAVEKEHNIKSADQGPLWNEMRRDVITGHKSEEKFFNEVAERYGVDATAMRKTYTRSFVQAFKPMEGMEELLNELAQRPDVILAVLSDTSPDFDKARKDFAIYKPFEKIFVSYEIGYAKPDPRAYEHVVRELGLPAENFLFIDDRPMNIEAAQNAGMHGTVFTSTEQLRRVLTEYALL